MANVETPLDAMLELGELPNPVDATEQQVIQAYQEIEAVNAAVAAEKKAATKKKSKTESMQEAAPEGQQWYFGKYAQKPSVGLRVRIYDSHLHGEDGQPIVGKYGIGPILEDNTVASVTESEDGKNVVACLTAGGTALVLMRTGLWSVVGEEKSIKKPHKRKIVVFGEKYDQISMETLQKLKGLSSKKRKTDREVKAVERKKAKAAEAVEKKKQKRNSAKKPKKAKKQVESSASSSEESSSEESSSSESDQAVVGEVLVEQIVERVSAILDAKITKILGKRKREDPVPAKKSKPAKKAKK
jgi:hypothetical protein